jgi:hypothetical protein
LESVLLKNLDNKIEFVDRVLSKITPKQRWLYLFNSLTPELQFTLLSCLIDYRRPTRNDWRNLFKKIEYEFKKGREYLIVLTVVFLLSLGSVIEIFAIMLNQPKSWVNGLMAITIAVVLSFLIVLLIEITEEDKSEPTLLMQLGLLGPWTFCREWYRLLRKNLVWEGITALYEAVVAMAVAVAAAAAATGAAAGAAAATGAVPVTVAGAGAVAVVAAAAAVGAIGSGLGIWYQAKEKTYWLWVRFLSILAFPWFCWFPIVFGFTSFALYHRLSWEWRSISLFWLVIFGFCAVLWVRGKELEEKARNPLRGVLDGQ